MVKTTQCGFSASSAEYSRTLVPQLIVLCLPVHRESIGEQEREHARALDVAQELEAEPLALVRAFDDAGNVGDDERAVVAELHDAEVRRERRERIVGDLGTRRGDHREQRALAGVGLPDEADVGDELELELERATLAFLAGLPLARRLVRSRREERVALPAPAALARR